jgi:benzoate-CoA ligase
MEVEDCLLTHPAVLEAAVVGTPDDQGLLKPRAYVVLRPGAGVSESELQTLTKQRLAPHKYPRTVTFVDELPKTATGKIQRYRLRELAAE